MQVLMASIGTIGDVNPLLGLAQELRRRGHRPTLIANGYFSSLVRSEGIEFVPTCSGDDYLTRMRRLQQESVFDGWKRGGEQTLERMPAVYQAIADRYVPGQTIVIAQGWVFGARIAQEKLGVPLATIHLQPLCFRSLYASSLMPPWMPRPGRRLIYRLVDLAADRVLVDELNAFRGSLGLSPVCRILNGWWNSPQCVIGMFPDWFASPQPDWPPNTLLAGFPQHDRAGNDPPPAELEEFLERGDPPLVFAQASWVQRSAEFFAASIDAARQLGCRAVLVTPHPNQVPSPLPDEMLHCRYAPYSHLLPRAAALVHSGGIGTLSQALSAGIPQLVVPAAMDQPDNAQRLAALGAGAAVPPKGYSAAAVRRLLDRLLHCPQVRDRCGQLAERCRHDRALETACDAIEQLAT